MRRPDPDRISEARARAGQTAAGDLIDPVATTWLDNVAR
jgi:hypothetical protein